MRGNYEPDKFTESDVLQRLEGAGLRYKQGHRYILSQCPTHEDKNPSVQIYKDDWFVNCHAGCGRYHITKAFPDLRESNAASGGNYQAQPIRKKREVKMPEYKQFDLMDEWKEMPLIPRDHKFKTIPLDILDDLGWRWVPEMNSYFIPYFSRSKTSIPFAQYRHLTGDRRFTFLKDAKPTCYGTWNLEPGNPKIFIVEGTSDCAVLDYVAVPWIGLPSAASGELLKAMAKFATEMGIELVYAGDNDAAGDKLREALDEVAPYRVKQPRKPHKDWGDFLEAEGFDAVNDYCMEELFPEKFRQEYPSTPEEAEIAQEVWQNATDVEKVQMVFPGAKELKIAGSPDSSKERTGEPTSPF